MSHKKLKSKIVLDACNGYIAKCDLIREKAYTKWIEEYKQDSVGFLWWKTPITLTHGQALERINALSKGDMYDKLTYWDFVIDTEEKSDNELKVVALKKLAEVNIDSVVVVDSTDMNLIYPYIEIV